MANHKPLSALVSSMKKEIDAEIKRYLREEVHKNPQDIRDYGLERVVDALVELSVEAQNHILKQHFTRLIPYIKFHLVESEENIKTDILYDYLVDQLADYVEPKLKRKAFHSQ